MSKEILFVRCTSCGGGGTQFAGWPLLCPDCGSPLEVHGIDPSASEVLWGSCDKLKSPRHWFQHTLSDVESGAVIGAGSKVWRFAHVRAGAVLGEDCMLGNGVFVDSGVTLGNGVRVQNGVMLYNGVTVEDDVFLGPNVVFTNDRYPRAFTRDWDVVPTLVKRGASIGANSTIVCGVTIGEYAMIGAGSVVARDVDPFELVVGNPLVRLGKVCKCGKPDRPYNPVCACMLDHAPAKDGTPHG